MKKQRLSNLQKKQIIIIHIVVILTYIGLALPYSIFPVLFVQPNGSNHLLVYSLIISLYPIGQAIGMILFGYISDFYGRKIVLQYTLLGATLTFILSGYCVAMNFYILLILVRFFCGLFEGNVAIALAAINDLFPHPNEKTKWFGRINVALSSGFIFGPFIGSLFSNPTVVHWFSFSTPFFLAGLLSLITFMIVCFFFEETFSTRSCLQLKSIFKTLKSSLIGPIYFLKKPGFNTILMSSLVITTSVDILYQFIPVYLVSQWQANTVYLSVTITSLCLGKIIGNYWLINSLKNFLKSSFNCILFGVFFLMINLLGLILVSSVKLFILLSFSLGIFISFSITNSMTAMSTYTSQYKQGRMLSVAQSLRMVTGAIMCNIAALTCNIRFIIPFVISLIFALFSIYMILINKRIYMSIHKKLLRRNSLTTGY